ncbi:MAG TPA: riboflavin synthase [Micromonosporaceae bacterium]|jgi:riboflavin synthase
MFTGIVEELGEVAQLTDLGDAARIAVRGKTVTTDARHGDSIAVNGVCLTVVDVDGDTFTADVMAETLDRSSLGAVAPGDPVNLERAALLSSRLGGHIVQGHVDGVGTIVAREPAEHWEVVTFTLPDSLERYVVEKGSITIDGVSLTVAAVTAPPPLSADPVGGITFSVSLIPTTRALTTLGHKGIGAPVNLEVDVIAKYVEKLLGSRSQGTASGAPEGRE